MRANFLFIFLQTVEMDFIFPPILINFEEDVENTLTNKRRRNMFRSYQDEICNVLGHQMIGEKNEKRKLRHSNQKNCSFPENFI